MASGGVSHQGKAVRWEGSILTWLDEVVHELGDFADTDWSQRTVVEIAVAQKTRGWFLPP